MARKPAVKAPPSKPRPKLEDLPPWLSLPMVAAFFGHHPSWAHKMLDREAGVLRVGDQVLRLHRHGREWRAWRADLADLDREKVA
jgi:hypothetical protein